MSEEVGKEMRFGDTWRTIVGVVADTRAPGLLDTLRGRQAYWPLSRHRNTASIVVRTPDERVHDLRAKIGRLDPDVVGTAILYENAPARGGLRSSVLDAAVRGPSSLALVLAALVLYAALNRFTVRHRGDIAVRMALGASAQNVRGVVVWQGVSRAFLEALLGLALSYPFCRVFSQHLFDTDADSLVACAFAGGLVSGVVLLRQLHAALSLSARITAADTTTGR